MMLLINDIFFFRLSGLSIMFLICSLNYFVIWFGLTRLKYFIFLVKSIRPWLTFLPPFASLTCLLTFPLLNVCLNIYLAMGMCQSNAWCTYYFVLLLSLAYSSVYDDNTDLAYTNFYHNNFLFTAVELTLLFFLLS